MERQWLLMTMYVLIALTGISGAENARCGTGLALWLSALFSPPIADRAPPNILPLPFKFASPSYPQADGDLAQPPPVNLNNFG